MDIVPPVVGDKSTSSASLDVRKNGEQNGSWVAPFSLISVAVIFFGAQLVGGLALYHYGYARGWTAGQVETWLSDSITAQFVFLVLSESLLMLGVYGLLRLLNWSWRRIGLFRPKLVHIAAGAAAVVPYYLLYMLIVAAVSRFVPSLNVDQKQDIGFNGVHGTTQLLLTFLSLVVIPPLVEEITMRGFLYSGLRTWLPKIAAALAVSVVFGAAHLTEGGDAGPLWIGAIDTFTLSLVLVYLREKTGNLWAGITLHALKNGIAFVFLFIVGVH